MKMSTELEKWAVENNGHELGFFEALGPTNTVADFVSELYDGLFRDILGNEVMDRSLGSFSKSEMFAIMAKIFLQDGNQRLFES